MPNFRFIVSLLLLLTLPDEPIKFRSGIYIEYPKKRILSKSTKDITHVLRIKHNILYIKLMFFTLRNVSRMLSLSSGVYDIDIFQKKRGGQLI